MNFPAAILNASRKPAIMAHAAYAVLNRDSRTATGNFYIDEAVLREEGGFRSLRRDARRAAPYGPVPRLKEKKHVNGDR